MTRDELITENVRLVYSYAEKFRGIGVDVDDLKSAGMIGLTMAADRFDPGRDVRFSTYSMWWIRHHVDREVHHLLNLVHVPIYLYEPRLRPRLMKNNEAYREKARMAKSMQRLDRVAPGTHSPLGELLPDREVDREYEPDEFDSLGRAIDGLDGRDRDIILSYFGIGRPQETFEQIGDRLGFCKERIRQLVAAIIDRLRSLMDVTPPILNADRARPRAPDLAVQLGIPTYLAYRWIRYGWTARQMMHAAQRRKKGA